MISATSRRLVGLGRSDQVIMRGNAIAEEVVFFHRKSGVVLFADLAAESFRATGSAAGAHRGAAFDGMICDEPRTPQKFRVAFTDRRVARASLAKVLAWPAEKVIMATGRRCARMARRISSARFAGFAR